MHLSSCNLLGRYNSDPEFALRAKMITSLACVPEADVVTAIAELENYLPNEFEPILERFIDNYIGRLRNNGTRVPPTFPSAIWSVYFRTLNGRDRTNNFAETCHRKLFLVLGLLNTHPTL
ncbi:hypothetical protein PPYR_07652 [Photinus pyralis]|uniref:Uncharacterized protein n=1 Tax=Photinus pyralis TaxID=7054 RepID=A0A5N4AQZ7_PHOPY|nr:hypothetical protein PPYR_07652 [Photinus pyralis]